MVRVNNMMMDKNQLSLSFNLSKSFEIFIWVHNEFAISSCSFRYEYLVRVLFEKVNIIVLMFYYKNLQNSYTAKEI